MSKQTDIERIEQYIDNQLNALEKEALEQRMSGDGEMRASVELHRQINAELANADQIRLLQSLDEIVQQPFEDGASLNLPILTAYQSQLCSFAIKQ